jgi:hypothetical protein
MQVKEMEKIRHVLSSSLYGIIKERSIEDGEINYRGKRSASRGSSNNQIREAIHQEKEGPKLINRQIGRCCSLRYL